ncbi:hypothetical protein ACLGL1_06965 [Peptococcus simiae]|uniref:hypothetical protein n=1 Tax=Peptococcus simiae TaxID=1643805 RepID=UPI00397F701E
MTIKEIYLLPRRVFTFGTLTREGRYDKENKKLYLMDDRGELTGTVLTITDYAEDEGVAPQGDLPEEEALPLETPQEAPREENNGKLGLAMADLSVWVKGLKKKILAGFRTYRTTELPAGLQKKVLMQYLMALGVFLFCIFLTITEKRISYLTGIVISLCFLYMALETKLQFAAGKIVEQVVSAVDVKPSKARNRTKVVFATSDDIPSYFTFVVPGKKDFILNGVYVIYFNEDRPSVLLGHVAL